MGPMQIPGNLQDLIQLLWHVLIQAVPFYIVVLAMSKLVFKPVLAVLAERERRMVGDKEDASLLNGLPANLPVYRAPSPILVPSPNGS